MVSGRVAGGGAMWRRSCDVVLGVVERYRGAFLVQRKNDSSPAVL